MTYTKVIIKNRVRDRRGQISDFNNLPNEVKDNFKRIKEFIEVYFNKEMDVRVTGSHLEGYFDEFSDYTVVINEDVNLTELKSLLVNELQLDITIYYDINYHNYSPSIIL
jgi:predicted nucleotidyltransferase